MGWFGRLFGFGGGYEAADRNSDKRVLQGGRRSQPLDEDSHVGPARQQISLEVRDQDRNNGLLFGLLNRIADYSVPSAIPSFHTSSAKWNKLALRWFKAWAKKENCDIRRLRSFDDLAWLALRESYVGGDGGFVLLKDGRLQLVDGELIATPDREEKNRNIVNGVELDAYGAPVAFWICPRGEGGLRDASRAVRVRAENFVFFRQFTRGDQTRGVSPVAPIVPDLIDQRDLHQNYLAKTRHETKDATVVTTRDGYMPNIPTDSGNKKPPPPRPASMEDTHMRTYFLRDGEDVHQINPSTPSANIVDYEKSLVRYMTSGVGIPGEMGNLDLTGLSWSTANATVKIAGDTFRRTHEWVEENVLRPIVDWRLLKAVENGELPQAPIDEDGFTELFNYRIPVPEYLWADEEGHLKAIKQKFQLGLPADKILADETGLTPEEILDARQAYVAEIYRRCAELEAQTGKPISPLWFVNAETSGVRTIPDATFEQNGAGKEGRTE